MPSLAELNERQKEAAMHIDGPCMVVAAAGSGKTAMLIARIQYLIDKKVEPRRILACTFTKKAAKEMEERLVKLVGAKGKQVTIGTIHAVGRRMLANQLPLNDENGWKVAKDPSWLIEMVLEEPSAYNRHGVGPIMMTPDAITGVAKAKADALSPEQTKAPLRDVYAAYETVKAERKWVDFEDMLLLSTRLMKTNPAFAAKWQHEWDYVLVDEFQDTNTAQWQFLLELTKHNENLFVVGDDWQCWSKDAKVRTFNGIKRIEELKLGDSVETVINGRPTLQPLTAKSNPDLAECLEIVTRSGRHLTITKNHKCFATLPDLSSGDWYLYMMYRHDRGFRLGISHGGMSGQITARTHPERAEAIWILRRFENQDEAAFAEENLSLTFQVPTVPYFHKGRAIRLNQTSLDLLFECFGKNGFKLLADMKLSFEYPNFIPQGANTLHGAQPPVYLNLNTPNNRKRSYSTDKGRVFYSFEQRGERIRKYVVGDDAYIRAFSEASELAKKRGVRLVERYIHGSRARLSVIPASGLMPTMQVPIEMDGKMILDEIVEVIDVGMQEVYHLEIASTGILIANGIASHNSVYGFRGARPQLMTTQFMKQFPHARRVLLTINYRSHDLIVDLGNRVIELNDGFQIKKTVEASREISNQAIAQIATVKTDVEEAEFVAQEISRLHDHYPTIPWNEYAVLYRTNIQSRVYEEALDDRDIPYHVVGDSHFYESRDVKAILDYLRTTIDQSNPSTWAYLLNRPKRYIPRETVQEVAAGGWGVLLRYPRCDGFVRTIHELAHHHLPADAIQWLVDTQKGLIRAQDEEEPIRWVDSLIQAAMRFRTVPDFLRYVDRIVERSKEPKKDAVQLSTIHRSKGLEYLTVFVVGMVEGLLPHKNSLEGESLREETRLCYVGLTRAKENLYLLAAKRYGSKELPLSRYLTALSR